MNRDDRNNSVWWPRWLWDKGLSWGFAFWRWSDHVVGYNMRLILEIWLTRWALIPSAYHSRIYPPSWDTYLGKRPHSQQWRCLRLWMEAVWIRSVWGLALARSKRGARSELVCHNHSQKIVDEREVPVCWKRVAQKRGRERGGVGRFPANMFA